MLKGTPETIAERREEIINACEMLYRTMSFKEITLKEIGGAVPFSRPTIYNYFQTKEEIFLALYKREYERWNKDLSFILASDVTMTPARLAEEIASSLAKRGQLLKLLAMNNYDMEAYSRPSMLTSFKESYGKSIKLISSLLEKFMPQMNDGDRERFVYVFFPFMFGIYPYTSVTDKQKAAMTDAGVDFVYQSVYEITYSCLIRLLECE